MEAIQITSELQNVFRKDMNVLDAKRNYEMIKCKNAELWLLVTCFVDLVLNVCYLSRFEIFY